MLSRLLPKSSYVRALTLMSTKLQSQSISSPKIPPTSHLSARFFSSNGDGGDKGDQWNLSQDAGEKRFGALFPGGDEEDDLNKSWTTAEEVEAGRGLFDIVDDDDDDERTRANEVARLDREEIARAEQASLQREEQALTDILDGPRRVFGDLITASGITDEMIDNLIALKDFEGVEGLPTLKELEEFRKEKGKKTSSEAEKERLKREEAAKARVRQVDENGRAYGTGRRKCSVARVWIQPGDGKFVVNDKDLDIYFPILDYRAALLRPFSETKTLGLWDVNCTVKGGGVTGQAGAILLGISRALQNWEPDLRPPLKAVGFLTRDPRMVERKKPGKAKARKSFQWVKR